MISVINAEAGWSILEALDQASIKISAIPKARVVFPTKRTLILQALATRKGYATQRTIRDAIGMPKSGFASALFARMEAEGVIRQGKPLMAGHGNRARTYRITEKGREEVRR
jgi:DNA-binding PadR family transcriptional regulator